MRPEDLAAELGVEGKRLRGWLRNRWPRRPEERGQAWYLTPDQVAEVRRAFAGARPRSSRPVIVRPAALPVSRPDPIAAPRATRLSWSDVQRYADAVLASGLVDLMSPKASPWAPVDQHSPGVYVFTDGEAAVYVGESISVAWRTGQHRDPRSSLMAGLAATGIADPVAWASSRLRIRTLPVAVGRLELEEFAIACLRPSANKMRRDSRAALAYATATTDLWRGVQDDATRLLKGGVSIAVGVEPVAWAAKRPPIGAGLYILRDAKQKTLYVGETDALAERLGTHSGVRSYFSALRRHVGTELLGLAFAPNVNRGFSPTGEAAISAYLATCSIALIPLAFGRWELERDLVRELRPILNREHAANG